MVNILAFSPNLYLHFFLILLRISGLFVTAPIIGSDTVPRTVRIFMILILSMILYNLLPIQASLENLKVIDYFLLCIKELMVGLLLGVVPRLMFGAVDFAGSIMGFQMGFSIANVVDPQTDIQVSLIASVKTVIATLLFLVLDGHHVFLEVIGISYEKIPIAGFLFSAGKVEYLLRLSSDMFLIGLQLGAPIIIALLLTNVILGFMARSIPQMNVFIVGFPLTIGLGLILMFIGMPYMVKAMSSLFLKTGEDILKLIDIMAK